MIGSARAGTTAERHTASRRLAQLERAHSKRARRVVFSLDNGLTWMIGRKSFVLEKRRTGSSYLICSTNHATISAKE